MNAAELAAIRARTTDGHWHPRADHRADAAAMLAELDLQWRAAESADAKINAVRTVLLQVEDAIKAHDDTTDCPVCCGMCCMPPAIDDALLQLRRIVGPR